MDNIAFLVYEFVHKKNWHKPMKESMAVYYYNKFVDENIRKYSYAYKVSANCLYVWVKSSAVASEISLRSFGIVDFINEKIGDKIISTLRFQLSDVDWAGINCDNVGGGFQKDKVLSIDDREYIDSLLVDINNFDVKVSLDKLFSLALKSR